MNAAIFAKQKRPDWQVAVLERGVLPSGASTKNAGFACFGSPSELLDDLGRHSEEEVFALVQKRWEGLQQLRSMLGEEQIGFEPIGSYEVFTPAQERLLADCVDLLPFLNEKVSEITGIQDPYQLASKESATFGFRNVLNLIANKAEGQLDTGKMMRTLLAFAREAGVELYTGMGVETCSRDSNGWQLQCRSGTLSTNQVVVATNGFAKQLLPELDVQPARAQVLITEPIEDLPFRGSFHMEAGYYYFRNVGNRVLFGGGRNLDFEGETTTELALTDQIQSQLEEYLQTVILPGREVAILQRWSGVMGVGPHKTTIVREVQPGLYCAVRMGGMGVAIGTLVGREAGELCVG